jgi:hypothetical protein
VPSIVYSVELRPDPLLRRIVLCSGGSLAACGLIVVASLPWSPALLIAIGAAWAGRSGWELLRLCRAWTDCLGLRLAADGGAKTLGADGRWRPAGVLNGSVLLRRWGWVRLRTESGTVFAEPLRGSCRKSHDWRRLQVIWRHVGAAR